MRRRSPQPLFLQISNEWQPRISSTAAPDISVNMVGWAVGRDQDSSAIKASCLRICNCKCFSRWQKLRVVLETEEWGGLSDLCCLAVWLSPPSGWSRLTRSAPDWTPQLCPTAALLPGWMNCEPRIGNHRPTAPVVGVPRQDRNNPKLICYNCLLTIRLIDKQLKARITSHSEMHEILNVAQ